MIPRKSDRILIQGITGKQGTFWTEAMQAYGSNVVGGVNPNKAGTRHLGVPVFATAREAAKTTPFDIACMFIPPMLAKDAAIDACEAGARLLVCLTEHIPSHDVMEMHVAARQNGTRIVGPNTAGLVTVGECFVGIMPAFNANVFRKGNVGVISRSGTLTYEAVHQLTQLGIGQSTCVGIGGDAVPGTKFVDLLALYAADPDTKGVVMIGEIGGSAEEEAAEFIKHNMKGKPVVGFIAGKTAPKGKRMGHAGAIIAGGKGTAADKIEALEAAGVKMAPNPNEIGKTMAGLL